MIFNREINITFITIPHFSCSSYISEYIVKMLIFLNRIWYISNKVVDIMPQRDSFTYVVCL